VTRDENGMSDEFVDRSCVRIKEKEAEKRTSNEHGMMMNAVQALTRSELRMIAEERILE
jgi:hypothetical protein